MCVSYICIWACVYMFTYACMYIGVHGNSLGTYIPYGISNLGSELNLTEVCCGLLHCLSILIFPDPYVNTVYFEG